jgi:hypothetical protein
VWLLPDDPLLVLAFIADLVVFGVVVLRIRHKREVRRQYIQNVLRKR